MPMGKKKSQPHKQAHFGFLPTRGHAGKNQRSCVLAKRSDRKLKGNKMTLEEYIDNLDKDTRLGNERTYVFRGDLQQLFGKFSAGLSERLNRTEKTKVWMHLTTS